MKYQFKVHKEKAGYWAECAELPGLQTQGASEEELRKNIAEALHLYLLEPDDSLVLPPLPQKALKGHFQVSVDPSVALSLHLRHLRKNRNLTQKKMTEILGYKNLYQYQRLEDPKYRPNPALSTLALIKEKFPEFRLEDLL